MDGRSKREIVDFLEQYPVKKRKIAALEQKIKELDELCYPNGVDPTKDKVTSSNTQDMVFNTVVQRDREKKRLESKKKQCERFVELHDMAFHSLSDTEQIVLSKLYHGRRYADGKIWLVRNGFPYSTLYRIQKKGLEKMHRMVFGNKEFVVIRKK